MHVVVIGGGIAGLSAAYHAYKHSHAYGRGVHVTVLEAAQYWGGKILTDRHDGFVIEGGPDTFLATKPWAVALCKELGIDQRLHGTNPEKKNTYVLNEGRLAPLPDGLTMMIPTSFGPMIRTRLLTWPQKARMGLDFLLPPQAPNGDESLGSFVSRRLGRAAYERLIEPLMSGIYAGDGDQLSLLSTFPYLRDLEIAHGGLVKGALSVRRKRSKTTARVTKNRSIFLTPTTGLAEIVEALVRRLEEWGAEMRLRTPAKDVRVSPKGYEIFIEGEGRIEADAVILATPAYISGQLLEHLSPSLASDLKDIPYVSTATVSLAYREEDIPHPLDGYGYVIPRREGRRALACTWTSTKFPHRAPKGSALLRVFIGRAGQEDDLPMDDGGFLEIARDELRLTLGVTAEPIFSRVYYWDRAMPQYNLGHPARLRRLEQALEQFPGLTLAGNGYEGIGIPDCINSGEKAALKVINVSKEIKVAE